MLSAIAEPAPKYPWYKFSGALGPVEEYRDKRGMDVVVETLRYKYFMARPFVFSMFWHLTASPLLSPGLAARRETYCT